MPLKPFKEPKSLSARIKGAVKGFASVSLLFPILLFVNLCQMLSMIVYPFSSVAVRKFNRWIANAYWGLCDDWVKFSFKSRIHFSGDDVPDGESVIVICNHQEMADIPVIFRLARAKGRLGDLKWFVKDILKYLPGAGWGMVFLDCLFVKRNWTNDEGLIKAVFEKIITNKIPVWIVTFAEGTRVKPDKIKSSQKFAASNDLPKLNHVLLPRTKGFIATCKGLRGHVDAVYDFTIGYEEGVPTLLQWAKGYAPNVHMHVKRFSMNDMPTDEQELSSWLMNLYKEKDQLLESFYKNGEFPA